MAVNSTPSNGRSALQKLASLVQDTINASERHRGLWRNLAWSIVISQLVGAGIQSDVKGRTAGSDDIEQAPHLAADAATGDLAAHTELAAADDDVATTGTDDFALGEPPSQEDGELHRTGSGNPPLTTGDDTDLLPHIAPIGSPGFFQAYPVSTTTVVGSAGDGFELKIPFFGGLAPFSQALGQGPDLHVFINNLDVSSKGVLNVALGFAESPLAPLQFWKSLGDLHEVNNLTQSDSIKANWAVQTSGLSIQHDPVQMQEVNGFDGGAISQVASAIDHSLGNAAALVQSNAWNGLLHVTGNYYEFNTIVQINVLLNDSKTVLDQSGAGGLGAGGVPGIHTGADTQHNTAAISDLWSLDALEGRFDPVTGHHVILGGASFHAGTMQVSSIVDLQNINYEISGDISALVSQGALPLTGITEGAKTQTDTATFVEGVSRDTTTSAQQFLQDHHGAPVTTVNGNYYQINTVFQLNIITDHTSTSQTTSGGTGGADVTSGGSLAFNTASISIDNLHNDLFVNGQYSQYNLVLQVNALQSTGSISELLHAPTSTSVLGSDPLGQASAALAATHDISPVHGTPGSVAAPLVSLPNPLDELALRGGATIDHLI